MEWEVIISAIVGVAGVIVGALITNAFNRQKVEAESTKTEAEANEQIRRTVMGLIEPLQKRLAEVEAELADYVDWANRLVKQIRCRGEEPVPFKSSKKGQT